MYSAFLAANWIVHYDARITPGQFLARGGLAKPAKEMIAQSLLAELTDAAKAGLALCALKEDNMSVAQDMVAELHKQHPADLDKPDVRRAISAVKLAADTESDGAVSSEADLRAELEANPSAHGTRFRLAQVGSDIALTTLGCSSPAVQ